MTTYPVTPIAKPRMTQSDKWKKRKCVQVYWAYKAELKALNATYGIGQSVLFVIPMAKSWSKKKKDAHRGMPHKAKPDLDNLLKGLWDAIYDEDMYIWHTGEIMKIWGDEGKIIINNQMIVNAIKMEGRYNV